LDLGQILDCNRFFVYSISGENKVIFLLTPYQENLAECEILPRGDVLVVAGGNLVKQFSAVKSLYAQKK